MATVVARRRGDDGGDGVGDRGQFAPHSFRGVGADQCRHDGKDRGQAEQRGQPFVPDHGERQGDDAAAR